MKRFLAFFLSVTLLLTCCPIVPLQATAAEELYTYYISRGKAIVTGCDDSLSGDIVIPDTLGGYPVTAIGQSAFIWTKLTSVVIPEGVTTIEDEAFYCSDISAVTIPESVTTIGKHAFDGSELTSLTIPNGVQSIGESAFGSCCDLTSVAIGNGVQSIAKNAFALNDALAAVHISDIAAWCAIEFENTAANPLYSGKNLYLNDTLITDLTIPYGMQTIGNYAFSNCKSLTSVNIPDSVQSIGDLAFASCTGLPSVTIPKSVTNIGAGAFGYCTGLTAVDISCGVQTIGEQAFFGCDNLTGFTVDISNPCYSNDDRGVLFNREKTELIQAPAMILDDYNIPDGVQTICDDAFYECTALTSVNIPDSVETIGVWAFGHCHKLTSVTIGIGLQTIHERAFAWCISLNTVSIGNSVQTIGTGAFSFCVSLTSLTIPESVQAIESDAFSVCASLEGLWVDENNPCYSSDDWGVLFNTEKTVLIQAPGGISVNYVIPDGVQTIDKNAFRYCGNLPSITIPDSVQMIGEDALYGTSSLTGIWVSGNNPNFSSDDRGVLFNKDKTRLILVPRELANYNIPDSVQMIDGSAFFGNDALVSVTIPDSVTVIGDSAFYSCDSLTDVYYIGTEEQWAALKNDIGYSNHPLLNANIHYSYINCQLVAYTDHSDMCLEVMDTITLNIGFEINGKSQGDPSGITFQLAGDDCVKIVDTEFKD